MGTLGLALLLTGGFAGLQSQPGPPAVVIVVDVDSPVADGVTAADLREQALAGIPRSRNAIYVELTARGITPVHASAAEGLRRAIFSVAPKTYGGVSMSFGEASEILRNNESVRDAVIHRACAPAAGSDCGGAVHAAAMALVSDTHAATARKVRHLLQLASSHASAALILVTAGWPYRDDRQLTLGQAARELQATGARLTVLRTPALISYQGLVKDATESIASRVSGTFVVLANGQDAARARDALSETTEDRPSSHVSPAQTETLLRSAATGHAPMSAGASDEVLHHASRYVARFADTFSAVIWRERYEQERRVRRRFNASGTVFEGLQERRVLDSELLFVWVPASATWVAVRDVIAVDGKQRLARDRQLPALMSSSAMSVDQLRQLARENGRFNVGRILRTFNEPTLPLLFLDNAYRHRFSFTRTGQERIDNVLAATYDFVERGKPTVIQDRDRDVAARGSVWIDEATGRVLQTVLLLDHSGGLQGRMTVRYRPDPKFDVLVPSEMRETYSSSGETVTTVATYSDFRRFETAGRLIVPK